SLGLAGTVDGVIVVADARKGTRASVAAAADQLDQVGGRVLGGVLNGFEPGRAEDRYSSYDDRRGLVSLLLMSWSGDADGGFALPADSRSDLEATPRPKDWLPTRSGYLAPPGFE